MKAYATWSVFATRRQGLIKHEVYLDNCSEVSILHPSFLTDLRSTHDTGFAGLSGNTTDITTVGYIKLESEGSGDIRDDPHRAMYRLIPAVNANGSWVFLNLQRSKY